LRDPLVRDAEQCAGVTNREAFLDQHRGGSSHLAGCLRLGALGLSAKSPGEVDDIVDLGLQHDLQLHLERVGR
jgi:hypothetical protein